MGIISPFFLYRKSLDLWKVSISPILNSHSFDLIPNDSMPSQTMHNLSHDTLRRIFELLRYEDSMRWSVSQVCKKWRQAALDSSALWSTNLYISPDISVLYKDILPRSRTRRIDNLILSSRVFSNQLDPKKFPVPPNINIILTMTVPNLLPRTRNLSLEVPSGSWHLLEILFKSDISNNLERLELTRKFTGEDGTDSSSFSHYTSPTLNIALVASPTPWKLRSLHLHQCILHLAPQFALGNLEELSIYNLPETISYTPRAIVALLSGLPQLRRLHLTWVTTPNKMSSEPFKKPTELNILETLSLTGPIDHCSFIFKSLSVPATCKVQIIAGDVSSVTIGGLVDKCLAEIASRHKSNIGSHLSEGSVASLQVTSGFCGIQPLDSHLHNGESTSPSFFFVLLPKDPTLMTADCQKTAAIDLSHLFRSLLNLLGAIFPSAIDLRLDIDIHPTCIRAKDQESYYQLQINVVRAILPRLRNLSLKYPSGKLDWRAAQS